MSKPFRDFDLPKQHFTGEAHFVPPKARTPEEIERRLGRPRGALLAEYLCRGAMTASHMLNEVQEPDDVTFAASVLARSGMNSAHYGMFTPANDVMRRRLKLPILATRDPSDRLFELDALNESRSRFGEIAQVAFILGCAADDRPPNVNRRHLHLGRMIGNGSLSLVAVNLGDTAGSMAPYAAQSLARRAGLQTLEGARQMSTEIGSQPSLAQLADPDSDLSVYIRRNAPDGVYEAFDEATEIYRIQI